MTRHTLPLTITVTVLAGIVAWFGFLATCLWSEAVPLCRHDYGQYIVPLLAMVLVIGSVAQVLHRRLIRRLARGMYAKPVGAAGAVGQVFGSVVRLAWEGELKPADPAWHPQTHVPAGHGWRVAMDDGTEIIVRWDDMNEWVGLCWEFQHNPANARQGATSHRVWDSRIGRSQVQARNHLLEVSGNFRRNKATANAIRRLEGTPWTIMAKLYEVWPPGVV